MIEDRMSAGSAGLAQTVSLAHDDLMPTDEHSSPEQVAALRAMTGQRRLRLAEHLYWSARRMKTAGLRSQHPDWPEQRLTDETRLIFRHART
jgi:hypothetical protein